MTYDTKVFHHFKDGYQISNEQINCWLGEVRDEILIDKEYLSISSGDTSVMGFKWQTCIEFVVSNSSGRSKIVFYTDEYPTLTNFTFNYTRPE